MYVLSECLRLLYYTAWPTTPTSYHWSVRKKEERSVCRKGLHNSSSCLTLSLSLLVCYTQWICSSISSSSSPIYSSVYLSLSCLYYNCIYRYILDDSTHIHTQQRHSCIIYVHSGALTNAMEIYKARRYKYMEETCTRHAPTISSSVYDNVLYVAPNPLARSWNRHTDMETL